MRVPPVRGVGPQVQALHSVKTTRLYSGVSRSVNVLLR